MPPTYPTLANLMIIGDTSLADLNVSNIVLASGLWSILFAQPSSNGTSHKYSREASAPVIGFRAPNAPNNNSDGSDELVTVDLKLLDTTVMADQALARGYPMGVESYMSKKGLRYLAAGFHTTEHQVFKGVGNDAGGFVGFADNAYYNQLSDSQVVNGGGAGATIESVWIIRSGEDDVSAIYNGEQAFELGEIVETTIPTFTAGNATGVIPGFMAAMMSWIGVQVGSKFSVVRVCNLDTTTNTVEGKIQDGLTLFPASRGATHVLMSRKMRRAVQRGRELNNASGGAVPLPNFVDDVPIVLSEALLPEAAVT